MLNRSGDMNYWDSSAMGQIYLVYGLSLFVLGVVASMLPKQNTMWSFAPNLSLLAAFGILHGTTEFIELQRLGNPAEWLTWLGRLVLLGSYAPLLEFGRRTWVGVSNAQHLSAPWVFGISGVGVAALTLWTVEPLAGLAAGTRFFVGAPAALLTGFGFFASQCTQGKVNITGRNAVWLHIIPVAFICYGLLTLFMFQRDPHLPAWLPTQADFLVFFGFPVHLLRAVCAMLLTQGFVSLVRLAGEKSQVDAVVFDSHESIVITDIDTVILRVNDAFVESTGYKAEEAVGHKVNLLKSGRHDKAFYAEMWKSINQTGSWQGEIWDRRKNGQIYPKWLNITAVKDANGMVIHYVGTHIDISERKAAESEIKHLAYYDPLTQLPNRRLLRDRLQQALATCARKGKQGALLFIDLDNFKALNDTYGHDKGDLLLQQVASRLLGCVRKCDTVARLGGDEFVIMLEELNEKSSVAAFQTKTIGEKILAALNKPYQLADHECHSTPSMGITLFRNQARSIDELLKHADIAMYQAKAGGRNTLRFFNQSMQAVVTARSNLEEELHKSLQKKYFFLHYQPQVDAMGRITGVEALVRWKHPLRGMVSPAEFIPLAEETGLILPLGQWIMETACTQLASWATSLDMSHLTVSVNVSARQFRQADFVQQVLKILAYTGANPQRLKLELTESLLVSDVEDVIAKMTALKVKGVAFSLDDFGTGYSSLSYLKRLPLDQLKIDQGFVRDILFDANDAAIAKMIIVLADSMGLEVIAEGVENIAQRDFLASIGCHAYQGYLFGRPAPAQTLNRQYRTIPNYENVACVI